MKPLVEKIFESATFASSPSLLLAADRASNNVIHTATFAKTLLVVQIIA